MSLASGHMHEPRRRQVIEFTCPACKAAPWSECKGTFGSGSMHQDRYDLAERESVLDEIVAERLARKALPGVDVQPRATSGDIEVWPLVLADIEARMKFGLEKYGVPLRTNDGRDSLVDAYQECLDQCVYLRKEIEERKARTP